MYLPSCCDVQYDDQDVDQDDNLDDYYNFYYERQEPDRIAGAKVFFGYWGIGLSKAV